MTAAEYEQLPGDYFRAHDDRDEAALQRLNRHHQRRFTLDDLAAEIWRRVYAYRQHRPARERPGARASAELPAAQDIW